MYDSVISVRPAGMVAAPSGPNLPPAGAVVVYDPPQQTATVTSYQPVNGVYTKTTAPISTNNQFIWFYKRPDGNLENRPTDANAPGLILFCNQA